ncbi:MAG: 4Fe-4S dicluster domain-containing protein [Chloroflexi bacterium]|nr:4Fe-4S dicluster domain-containing protein [Chloroflexota bacterium]
MTEIAILLDMSQCIGCRACQMACKEWNDLPAEVTTNHGSYENPPHLSAVTWSRIRFIETATPDHGVAWHFINQRCLHCTDAACVKACETGALEHNELGFVSYDPDACIGCGLCAQACPFGMPQLSETAEFPSTIKMSKCTFCQDRVTNNLMPACAKACPTGAIQFGEREPLIAQGKARAARLKQQGYANARLYGETEMGGLHQMYVLTDSPVALGLPENPQPRYVVQTPELPVALGFAVAGAAIGGLVAFRARAQKKALS